MGAVEGIPVWLQLAILALGAFRLAVLISNDSIFDRPRNAVMDWAETRALNRFFQSNPEAAAQGLRPQQPFLVRLLMCTAWCVSVWTSTAAVAAWYIDREVTVFVLLPLAIAGVVGLITPDDVPEPDGE